ncbi:MAG: hypothetical protein J5548_11315 [Prevotella sp.]|nr:hypothetical protein [Prevotella sp.]
MSKTRKCPACGREIFMHAQVCPYCKAETHFISVDEEQQPEDIEEVVPASEPEYEEEEHSSDQKEEKRLGKYIDHLKKDKDKVKKQYQKKIKSKYSGSTILITSVIIFLSVVVLALYIAKSSMEQKTFKLSNSVDNTMKEVLDSVESKLYQRSSTIVAKFPDKEKHCLFYLQENHLFLFDAKDKSNKELNLPELNAKAIVDFKGNGVQSADPSANQNYIIIIAARNPVNSEFGLYRLGTDPDNLTLEYIDKGSVMKEKGKFTVLANGRQAVYDDNGDKISGLTEAEWANMPKQQVDNTPKKNTQEAKPSKPKLPSRDILNEEVRRSEVNIDIDPPSKPQKPELP